jgi:hypothetical protein
MGLMSWADDIRCLYCDGRLPLYRKITNGQFCSGAHRKAYWKEHERLAVERLHQTHNDLRAYRPPGAVERILGVNATEEEASPLFPGLEGSGVGSEAVSVQRPTAVSIAPAALSMWPNALADDLAVQPALHSVAPLEGDAVPTGGASFDSPLADGRAALEHAALEHATTPDPAIAGPLRQALFAQPRWLPDSLAAIDLTPFESTNVLRWPVIVWARREWTMASAPAVPMALAIAAAGSGARDLTTEAGGINTNNPSTTSTIASLCAATNAAPSNATSASAIYPNVDAAHPRITLTLDLVPQQVRANGELPTFGVEHDRSGHQSDVAQTSHDQMSGRQIPAPRVPEMAGMLALGVAQAREVASAALVPMAPVVSPVPIFLRAQLPLNIPRIEASLVRAGLMHVGLLHAGLRELPVSMPVQSASLEDGLRAIDLRAGLEAPLYPPPASPGGLNLPRLSLAAGSRYRMETQSAPVLLAPPQPEGLAAITTALPLIALPARSVKAIATVAMGAVQVPVYIGNDIGNDITNDVPDVSPVLSAEVPAPVRADVGAPVLTTASTEEVFGELNRVISDPSQATAAAETPATLNPEFEPSPTGLLPLARNAQPSQPASDIRPAPLALSLPQPLTRQPMCPESKLEPMDSKPASDLLGGAKPRKSLDPLHSVQYALHWTHAIDFWNRAPRDLKMLVFAIPLLLGLALHPALPKVRVAAPAAANGIERNVERAFNDQWVNVKQTMFDRAAVALDEDFRSGLDDWASRDDATAEWSFDATGFVRPGPLALYRPSMGLSDYQMQFLGVIDKQALSWVVRAADYDNFYVIKLQVLKSGPLPTIGVVRYAVVNGKADSRVDTIAPIDARSDMLYRVRLDVRGDDFALSVQGQMVDSWSEPRLRRGGIGFFSARGEESRLRWVQLTHQYDMLGRLCAYLAPYNVPTASGTWQP